MRLISLLILLMMAGVSAWYIFAFDRTPKGITKASLPCENEVSATEYRPATPAPIRISSGDGTVNQVQAPHDSLVNWESKRTFVTIKTPEKSLNPGATGTVDRISPEGGGSK